MFIRKDSSGDTIINTSMVNAIKKRDDSVKQKYEIEFIFNNNYSVKLNYNSAEERNEHWEKIFSNL